MRTHFRFSVLAAILLLTLTLAGCDGGGKAVPVFRADILSSQATDGDISYDPVLQSYSISGGPPAVFFGVDDLDAHLPEYRAFLDFPLDGSTGEDVVPASATIVSASVQVFVNEVSFATVVPTLVDLIVYPLSGPAVADFDSAPLATQSLDFFPSDEGHTVSIDVTLLMREAQRLGLADFQVRFLLDFITDIGLVGIEDEANIAITAPRLIVRYTL